VGYGVQSEDTVEAPYQTDLPHITYLYKTEKGKSQGGCGKQNLMTTAMKMFLLYIKFGPKWVCNKALCSV
jgi:hypothetical protein